MLPVERRGASFTHRSVAKMRGVRLLPFFSQSFADGNPQSLAEEGLQPLQPPQPLHPFSPSPTLPITPLQTATAHCLLPLPTALNPQLLNPHLQPERIRYLLLTYHHQIPSAACTREFPGAGHACILFYNPFNIGIQHPREHPHL